MRQIKALFLLNLYLISCESHQHSVSKRALFFPTTTVLQFTYGLSVPLVLPKRSINFSAAAQTNYNLPKYPSVLQPQTVPARKYSGLLGITRSKFYEYIIKYLESLGLEGRECLLRTICETAETPLHIKQEGTLLEKMVHFIFTPSMEMYSTITNLTRHDGIPFNDQLLLAENVGKDKNDCSQEYSDCLVSILDIFTAKFVI